ncbi:MAG TPA: zinc ribbon domain-containing protein [Dehalococcoidia bacterium]|nr:zinc ribbon domain-containing protein [Dehalococcoidia bacterium]
MPRYDFRCPRCGLEFEVSRPFSQATDPANCPNDGTQAERVFSMPMTFVKGSESSPPSDSSPSSGDGGHSHGHGHGHTHGPGGHTH